MKTCKLCDYPVLIKGSAYCHRCASVGKAHDEKRFENGVVIFIGGVCVFIVLAFAARFVIMAYPSPTQTLQGGETTASATSPQLQPRDLTPSRLPLEPPRELPRPALSPPTQESDAAWHTLLLVADQAGIVITPDQQLSFSDWTWLTQRVGEHITAVEAIDDGQRSAIANVMQRKAMVGDFDLITADTSVEEMRRLREPTQPGQVVTLIGEAGQTKIVRVNLTDDYLIEASHARIKELEQILLLEVTTKLRLK